MSKAARVADLADQILESLMAFSETGPVLIDGLQRQRWADVWVAAGKLSLLARALRRPRPRRDGAADCRPRVDPSGGAMTVGERIRRELLRAPSGGITLGGLVVDVHEQDRGWAAGLVRLYLTDAPAAARELIP